MEPRSHQEIIRMNFDSFCKKVSKHKPIDLQRQMSSLSRREVPMSELSERELAKLAITDDYFSNEFVFSLFGESVAVVNSELGRALNELSTHRRDIILMKYFFDMSDKEISERLNIARRTVVDQRISTLKILREIIENEGRA